MKINAGSLAGLTGCDSLEFADIIRKISNDTYLKFMFCAARSIR